MSYPVITYQASDSRGAVIHVYIQRQENNIYSVAKENGPRFYLERESLIETLVIWCKAYKGIVFEIEDFTRLDLGGETCSSYKIQEVLKLFDGYSTEY